MIFLGLAKAKVMLSHAIIIIIIIIIFIYRYHLPEAGIQVRFTMNICTIQIGQAAPLLLTSMLLPCYLVLPAGLLLSSRSDGVWLGYDVAHTRQEGGPLPTQRPPSPATTTSNSLQLSSRSGV